MGFMEQLEEFINSYQTNTRMINDIRNAIESTAAVPKIDWNEDTIKVCRESVKGRIGKYSTRQMVTSQSLMETVVNAPKGSIALCSTHFTNPGLDIKDEQDVLLSTGLYEILDSYRVRYYLPHFMEYCKGLLCHCCLMSMGVPYLYNGQYGITNFITSSAVRYNHIKNIRRADRDSYTEEAVKIMHERQEFIYLMAASTGATVFIAGGFGCGVEKNSPVYVAKGWLDCSMKYPGLFERVLHPIQSRGANRVFKDILEEGGS